MDINRLHNMILDQLGKSTSIDELQLISINDRQSKVYYKQQFLLYLTFNMIYIGEQTYLSKSWIVLRNKIVDQLKRSIAAYVPIDTVCVVCVNRAHDMIKRHIDTLKHQSKRCKIILWCAVPSDVNIAQITEQEYIESATLQECMYKVRDMEPRYVILTDPADLYMRDWIKQAHKTLHDLNVNQVGKLTGLCYVKPENKWYSCEKRSSCLMRNLDLINWDVNRFGELSFAELVDSTIITLTQAADPSFISVTPADTSPELVLAKRSGILKGSLPVITNSIKILPTRVESPPPVEIPEEPIYKPQIKQHIKTQITKQVDPRKFISRYDNSSIIQPTITKFIPLPVVLQIEYLHRRYYYPRHATATINNSLRVVVNTAQPTFVYSIEHVRIDTTYKIRLDYVAVGEVGVQILDNTNTPIEYERTDNELKFTATDNTRLQIGVKLNGNTGDHVIFSGFSVITINKFKRIEPEPQRIYKPQLEYTQPRVINSSIYANFMTHREFVKRKLKTHDIKLTHPRFEITDNDKYDNEVDTLPEDLDTLLDTRCDFIIGYRADRVDKHRLENLIALLRWISQFNTQFTVWIVEQDDVPRLQLDLSMFTVTIKTIFLYNPKQYNRGWSFNCCLKQCENQVIIFGDTDVLFDYELLENVDECNRNLCDFISPYKYIYYTTPGERIKIISTLEYSIPHGSNSGPVTFCGGIMICRRDAYLKLGGFEEFNGYGYEDRALDILIETLVPKERIKINNKTYVHLWHPKSPATAMNSHIATYFKEFYCNSMQRPNNINDYIHINNVNKSRSTLVEFVRLRKTFETGNIDYYKFIKEYVPPNTMTTTSQYFYTELAENLKFGIYLRNKRVAVIGPAPTIIGSNQCDAIEKYDVIVRLNKAFPVPESMQQDVGRRTDILYNCLNENPENGGVIDFNLAKKNLDWIASPYPPITPFDVDHRKFHRNNTNKVPFHHINIQLYNKIATEMNTRPNTGTACILDLLTYDIKELYITGITFFKGGYAPQYRPYDEQAVLNRMAETGHHDQHTQFNYVRNKLINDSRVKVDKPLEDILREGLTFAEN